MLNNRFPLQQEQKIKKYYEQLSPTKHVIFNLAKKYKLLHFNKFFHPFHPSPEITDKEISFLLDHQRSKK